MPIRFEKTGSFERLPEGAKRFAHVYFLIKTFGSLDEALGQKFEGRDLRWYGFYNGRPEIKLDDFHRNNQVPIGYKITRRHKDELKEIEVFGLVAKFED